MELAIIFNWSANVTCNKTRKLILVEEVNFIKTVRYARYQASAAQYLRPSVF